MRANKPFLKVTALALVVAMIFGATPVTVFAEGSGDAGLGASAGFAAPTGTAAPAVDVDITADFTDPIFRSIVYEVVGKTQGQRIYKSDVSGITDFPRDGGTDFSMLLFEKGITSLAGIEHFTALQELYCVGNQLTSLDVSKNTSLYGLYCSNNQLKTLNVSGCVALYYLDCRDNQLTSLDMSSNTDLYGLDCLNNYLTSLDVSKNPQLGWFACSYNYMPNVSAVKTAKPIGDFTLFEFDPQNAGNPPSADCEVLNVTRPDGAKISGLNITHTIPYSYNSQAINVTVSPGANWKLYSDAACTKEIVNNTMLNLVVGNNIAYLKVTAGSGGASAVYTVTITRQGDPNQKVSDIQYLAFSNLAYANLNAYSDTETPISSISQKYGSKQMWRDSVSNKTWYDVYQAELQGWQVIKTYGIHTEGFYAVGYYNPSIQRAVLAYRGSQDISGSGKDDWTEDFIFGISNELTPQFYDARDCPAEFLDYVQRKYNLGSDRVSVTGHSLGGGLAYLASDMYGLEAVGFDPAPMRDVGYYYMWKEMSVNFRGTNAWKAKDYSNEHDRMVGLMEYEWRDAYFVKNLSTDVLGLPEGGEAYRPHTRESIFTFDESKNAFRLSDVVWQTGKGNMQNNWLKGKVVNRDALIIPMGSMKLGTTGVNTLNGKTTIGPAGIHTDVLYGGDGNDTLAGHQGDDVLIGGRGYDFLDGGSYDDKYVYQKGDGRTDIWDISGKDILYLYGFTSADNITFAENSNSYSILYNGETIISILKYRDKKRANFNSFKVEWAGKERKLDTWVERSVKSVSAWCPVEMRIFAPDGNPVVTLENGEEQVIHEEFGNFYVVQDDETGDYGKIAALFDEGHSIEFTGTGDGVMQYSVEDTDDEGNPVFYYTNDIPITSSTVITTSEDGVTLYVDDDGDGSVDSEVTCTTTGGSTNPINPEENTVTVIGGTADKASYTAGETVTVTANDAPAGQRFKNWTITPDVTFTNGTSAASRIASFTMPAQEVTATANYENIPAGTIPVTGVTLDRTSLSLYSNASPGSATLTATVFPDEATDKTVEWVSGNMAVAMVDQSGNVQAVGNGTAVITVTATDGGYSASCTVTVSSYSGGSSGYTNSTGDRDGSSYGGGADTATSMPAITWMTASNLLNPSRSTGIFGVRGPAWAKLAGKAYHHDTLSDGAVQMRLYIDNPSLFTRDAYVSGWVKGADADRIRGVFEKWFSNKVRAIHFDQEGEWEQPVRIAAKVDLTGWDTKNLYFYTYNPKTNRFNRIKDTAYWIDGNGYLHFTTGYAGDILISENPLEKK